MLLRAFVIASVFQIYAFPIGNIYLSMLLLTAYACVPLIRWNFAITFPVISWLGVLVATQFVSLFWSVDVTMGARDIVYTMIYVVAICWGLGAVNATQEDVLSALRICCRLGIVQSLLVIAFRLSPEIEDRFLNSSIARWVINPNGLDLFFSTVAEGRNNVIDPDKAGGICINANVAGIWALILCFATLATFEGKLRRVGIFIAIIHLFATFASGSKSALYLAFVAPLASIFLIGIPRYQFTMLMRGLIFLLFLAIGGLMAPFWLDFMPRSDIGEATLASTESRLYIWTHAWEKFCQSPLFGQGYGGWVATSPISTVMIRGHKAFGVSENFPLHNSILILWSQSGLPAVFAGIGMVVASFIAFIRNTKTNQSQLAFWGLAAYVGFIVSSLGANYTLVGEEHFNVPIGLLIGLAARTPNDESLEIV